MIFFGISHWFKISRFVFIFRHIAGTAGKSLISESFEFQFFSNFKEGIHIFLVNFCFSKVEKVQDGQQVLLMEPSEVDQWARMFDSLKHLIKEWTGGCQDNLVCLHLMTILTCQGHISELFLIFQTAKGTVDIFFEVIPLHPKLFRHCKSR